MNASRIKSLFAALLFAPLVAQAVYLDGDGTGQALIYPYYTAQSVDGNPFNTFVTVVNSSADAKALRVRFREARNGAPVLSFNLFLAPFDVWTGAVVPFATGTRLLSTDLSCTDPPFPVDFAPGSVPFRDFSNAAYVGDGAGDGTERTREGFVEILEMATLRDSSFAAVVPLTTDGVPSNCAGVRGASSVAVTAPSGGLSGTLTLINVASGMDFTVRADALAQLVSRSYYRQASDPYPDLGVAEIDAVSTVAANGVIYRSLWSRPVDAVSATLMRSRWLSEYILDTNTRSRTDVVVTFPTRRFYVTAAGATLPFTAPTMATCGPGQGERFLLQRFDREERFFVESFFDDLLPLPPPPLSLCAASTAVAIVNGAAHMPAPGASGVVGASSTSFLNVSQSSQGGWLQISPASAESMLSSQDSSTRLNSVTGAQSAGAHAFSGLPVVGFALRTFRSDNLSCPAGTCQGNFGGAYPLRFRRSALPAS